MGLKKTVQLSCRIHQSISETAIVAKCRTARCGLAGLRETVLTDPKGRWTMIPVNRRVSIVGGNAGHQDDGGIVGIGKNNQIDQECRKLLLGVELANMNDAQKLFDLLLAGNAPEKTREVNFDQLKRIVNEENKSDKHKAAARVLLYAAMDREKSFEGDAKYAELGKAWAKRARDELLAMTDNEAPVPFTADKIAQPNLGIDIDPFTDDEKQVKVAPADPGSQQDAPVNPASSLQQADLGGQNEPVAQPQPDQKVASAPLTEGAPDDDLSGPVRDDPKDSVPPEYSYGLTINPLLRKIQDFTNDKDTMKFLNNKITHKWIKGKRTRVLAKIDDPVLASKAEQHYKDVQELFEKLCVRFISFDKKQGIDIDRSYVNGIIDQFMAGYFYSNVNNLYIAHVREAARAFAKENYEKILKKAEELANLLPEGDDETEGSTTTTGTGDTLTGPLEGSNTGDLATNPVNPYSHLMITGADGEKNKRHGVDLNRSGSHKAVVNSGDEDIEEDDEKEEEDDDSVILGGAGGLTPIDDVEAAVRLKKVNTDLIEEEKDSD